MKLTIGRIKRGLKHPFAVIRFFFLRNFLNFNPPNKHHLLKIFDEDLFLLLMGEKINWENPQDLNQWIHWLFFNTDTSSWSCLADKHAVRQIIINKGLNEILVKRYGVWDNINDLNFSNLPNSFVLKMNNGCGDIKIIENKHEVNLKDIKEYYTKYFHRNYGENTIEQHYSKIKPYLLAEELLDIKEQDMNSSSMIDYKFWCFNGIPKICFVALNRTKAHFTIDLYTADEQWQRIENGNLVYDEHHLYNYNPVPKPKSLSKMLAIAAILSKGYPQMRVDLYNVKNNVYFGELTMTSQAGSMNYFTKTILTQLGEYCKKAYETLNLNEEQM